MEFVESQGVPAEFAYTPKINDFMLDKVYNEAIADGLPQEQAAKNRANAQRDIKELLAKNGMLK